MMIALLQLLHRPASSCILYIPRKKEKEKKKQQKKQNTNMNMNICCFSQWLQGLRCSEWVQELIETTTN